jgi:hypothetical protein
MVWARNFHLDIVGLEKKRELSGESVTSSNVKFRFESLYITPGLMVAPLTGDFSGIALFTMLARPTLMFCLLPTLHNLTNGVVD